MDILSLLAISVGLAMDAFAVAVCKGLAIKKIAIKNMFKVGIWFGLFQGLMPLIGYFLGMTLEKYITSVDHWVSLLLLSLIGISMIKEALNKDSEQSDDDLTFKTMFLLAIATSIDALAIGVTLAFLNVNIFISVLIIGIITFILSAIGVKVGNLFGLKYKSKAEIAGGIILIIMGIKILFEHLSLI